MPRRIIEVDPTAVWYRPDIDDNRKDPDPFRVLISPLSVRERRKLTDAAMRRALAENGNSLDEVGGDLVLATIAGRVSGVEGYSVKRRDGEVLTPATGQGLVDAVLDAPADEMHVLNDVYAAICDASNLAAGVWENSGGPLGTSAPATPPASPPKSGTVTTAGTKTLDPATSDGLADASSR